MNFQVDTALVGGAPLGDAALLLLVLLRPSTDFFSPASDAEGGRRDFFIGIRDPDKERGCLNFGGVTAVPYPPRIENMAAIELSAQRCATGFSLNDLGCDDVPPGPRLTMDRSLT